MAAKVANELAAMILDRNQRQRTDRAGSTLRFFNQAVDRLSSDLNRLEADILKFKTQNKDTLPESLDFRRNQQGSLQERLISLEREETDLRTKRGNLIATYTNAGQFAGAAPVTPEQQMLADLNWALCGLARDLFGNEPAYKSTARPDRIVAKFPVGQPYQGRQERR